MESQIKELESSLSSLENDLRKIQNKEADVKSTAENASNDIDRLKEELAGKGLLGNNLSLWSSILKFSFIHFFTKN